MFSRRTLSVWIGIIFLSGMFLMGQDAWPPPVTEKTVFVTDGEYDGNLGGLLGADAICQAEADAAGLSGTFKAWLSNSTQGPATRFVKSAVPYVLAHSQHEIAADWADLTSGSVDHAIDITASGLPAPVGVWTNTDEFGMPIFSYLPENCSNFTSTNQYQWAVSGSTSDTNMNWTSMGSNPCSTSQSLYCFQQ